MGKDLKESSGDGRCAPGGANRARRAPLAFQTYGMDILVPPDVGFEDLQLHRGGDGGLTFRIAPVKRVLEASGIPPEQGAFLTEDFACELCVRWHEAHVAAGGAPDQVAVRLAKEMSGI
jgi:hypothetical protein